MAVGVRCLKCNEWMIKTKIIHHYLCNTCHTMIPSIITTRNMAKLRREFVKFNDREGWRILGYGRIGK